MANEASFTLNFKTVAELTGLDRLASGLQARLQQVRDFNSKIQNGAAATNAILQQAAALVSLNALRSYARDAEEANLAQAKLQQALVNSGQATSAYKSELDATAKSLQALTGIDDDVITSVQGTLIGFGVQRDAIKELTGLTLDFAEFMGTDAVSAATLLGRAMQGEEISLRGMRLEIDKNLPKHEQLAQLMEKLGAVVGGQAEAGNKATGGLRGYRTELKNLGEDVGQVILTLEKPFLRGFIEQIRNVVEWLRTLKGEFPALKINVEGLAEGFGRIVGTIGPVVLGLTALSGLIKVITFAIAPLRSLFVLLTGLSFLQFIREVQTASRVFSIWQSLTVVGTGSVSALTLALRGLAVAALAAAVGFAAWKLGEWISQLVIAGATVTQQLQRMVYGAQHAFNEIDRWIMTISREIAFGALKIFSAAYTQIREFAGKIADVLGHVNPVAAWGLKKAIGLSDWMGLPSPEEIDAQKDKSIAAINKAHDDARDAILGQAGLLEGEIDEDAKKRESEKRIDISAEPYGPPAPAATGVPAGGDGAGGTKAAAAADTDALTQAKDRLSTAEEFYQTQIERTRLLEESGAISAEQGARMRRDAAQAYLEKLHELEPVLEALIAREIALGDTDAANQLINQLEQLKNKAIEAQAAISNDTFFGKIRTQLVQLQNDWADLGKQVGGFLVQQFNNLASTAGSVVGGLIKGTLNWKATLVDLFASFVSGLVTMVVQWLLARTVISTLNRIFGNTDTQVSGQLASEAAAQWAPAATAASIASYGAAAGLGVAAFLAAIGVGTAGAIAASSVGGGGFKEGGFTFGKEGQFAGFVHGEEFIFSAPAVRHYGVDFLDRLHEVGLTRPSYQGGGAVSPVASAIGGSLSVGGAPIFKFYSVTSMAEIARLITSDSEGSHHLIDFINGNIHLIKKD